MKNWMKDAIFIFYVVIVLPVISLIYFGYAFTNFNGIVAIIGGIIMWLILIPYPVRWYLRNRIFIQE